jgi:hypothetical protein
MASVYDYTFQCQTLQGMLPALGGLYAYGPLINLG